MISVSDENSAGADNVRPLVRNATKGGYMATWFVFGALVVIVLIELIHGTTLTEIRNIVQRAGALQQGRYGQAQHALRPCHAVMQSALRGARNPRVTPGKPVSACSR